MQNIYSVAGTLFAGTILTGCVSAGNYPQFAADQSSSRPGVKDLIGHVTCELKASDVAHRLDGGNYVVTVNLTLDVEDELGSAPSLGYTEPLALADTTFNATLAGDFSRGRTRKFTTSYTLDAQRLKGVTAKECADILTARMGLGGDLGIAEIVRDGFDAKDHASNAAVLKPDKDSGPSFGSTVEFVVSGSGKAGVGWKVNRYEGPGEDGSLFRTKRITTDTLVLGFAPVYVPAPKPSPITLILIQISIAKRQQADEARSAVSKLQGKLQSLETGPKSSTYLNERGFLSQQLADTEIVASGLEAEALAAAKAAEVSDQQDKSSAAEDGQGDAARQSQQIVTTQILQNIAAKR